MKGKRRTATIAAIVALGSGFIAAGCGDDEDEPTTASSETSMEESASATPGTDTPAAELRAGMTHLLTEHVDLAGIAVVQGVQNGLDSKQFTAAAETLDTNSQDLADAVGSVYGDQAGKQFLDLWRAHIGFFVDYTAAQAAGDEKAADKARADLDGYRSDFGAFIESATEGGLSKMAVADALETHTESLFDTIDIVVSGEGNPFTSLQKAASHMPGIAAVLSGAIAEQNGLEGSVDSGASELRSNLTALLDGHVYAAALAIVTAIGEGADSPEYAAAGEALQANTDELSATIGSVYGDEAGDQFKDLWESHIGFFVDYTLAKAGGDEKAAKKAEQDLDGYREDFGAFLESANPNLTKEAVAEALDPHVQSLLTTIDSAIAGDTKVFSDLRTAASHDVDLANTLAGAIAAQFPEMFGSS